jgi:hypothetical protein
MCLRRCLLRAAWKCHHTIRVIAMLELFLHGTILDRSLVELVLESDRGIVSTENLRAKAVQVRLQVRVQMARLCKTIESSGISVYSAKGPFKTLTRYQINRPSPSCPT